MRYPGRVTMCVSSQAGCGMNCPFCATGQAGLTRNMSTAEIVEQVVHARPVAARAASSPAAARTRPLRVSNVVFMGMGEALANYKAADRRDPAAHRPGARRARACRRAASRCRPSAWCRRSTSSPAEGIPVTLALSLHAPDDELRDELVPINTRWKVDEALDAAHRYFEATGRRVSIEYALIRDINDQAWRADLLGRASSTRAGAAGCTSTRSRSTRRPARSGRRRDPGVEQQFVERLRAHGIPTTVRDTRGSDIDGACGQLAAATA